MKELTIGFCALVSLWDAFTTISGTINLLNDNWASYFLSIICAIFVGGMMVNTVPVLTNPRGDIFTLGAKGMWLVSIGYDLYTAFKGNVDLVGQTNSGVGILLVMTLITVSCPITLSYILFRNNP